MKYLLSLLLMIGLSSMALSQYSVNIDFTDTESEPSYQPLTEFEDARFQHELMLELKKNKRWSKLIDQKKMAIGLVDLRDKENIRFAQVNGR